MASDRSDAEYDSADDDRLPPTSEAPPVSGAGDGSSANAAEYVSGEHEIIDFIRHCSRAALEGKTGKNEVMMREALQYAHTWKEEMCQRLRVPDEYADGLEESFGHLVNVYLGPIRKLNPNIQTLDDVLNDDISPNVRVTRRTPGAANVSLAGLTGGASSVPTTEVAATTAGSQITTSATVAPPSRQGATPGAVTTAAASMASGTSSTTSVTVPIVHSVGSVVSNNYPPCGGWCYTTGCHHPVAHQYAPPPPVSAITQSASSAGQGNSTPSGASHTVTSGNANGSPAVLPQAQVLINQRNQQHVEEFTMYTHRYGQRSGDMSQIQWPPGWEYPSDAAFNAFFSPYDFTKSSKQGTLRKFDGTIEGYQAFKDSYIQHVHVQREGYLHKITVLDSLMPESILKGLFQGLGTTLNEYRLRAERLESTFGGIERQMEGLIKRIYEFAYQRRQKSSLQQTRDLREFVYSVEAFFKNSGVDRGEKKAIAGCLKGALPPAIRYGYNKHLRTMSVDDTPERLMNYLQLSLESDVRSAEQGKIFEKSSEGASDAKKAEKPSKRRFFPSKEERRKPYGSSQKPHGSAQVGQYDGATQSASEEASTEYESCGSETTETPSEPELDTEVGWGCEESGCVQAGKGRSRKSKTSRPFKASAEPSLCDYCKKYKHFLHSCEMFYHAQPKERRQFVEKERRCLQCLQKGHSEEGCRMKSVSCRYCKENHNSLLHTSKTFLSQLVDAKASAAKTSGAGNAHVVQRIIGTNMRVKPVGSNDQTTDLDKSDYRFDTSIAAVATVVANPLSGEETAINVLCDSGASHLLLDLKVYEQLRLEGRSGNYTVISHGGRKTTHPCYYGTLNLKLTSGQWVSLEFIAYEGPCQGVYPDDWKKLKGNWSHLADLPIKAPVKGRQIEAILGCRYMSLFAAEKPAITGGLEDPVAIWTQLGWLVAGQIHNVEKSHSHTVACLGYATVSACDDSEFGIAECDEVSGDESDSDSQSEYESISSEGNEIGKFATVVLGDELDKVVEKYYQDPQNQNPVLKELLDLEEIPGNDLEQPLYLEEIPDSELSEDCGNSECRRKYSQLKDEMRCVWNIETEDQIRSMSNAYFPPLKTMTEAAAEQTLLDGLEYDENHRRYTAPLLWRDLNRPVNNCVQARAAFESFERQLARNEDLKQAFHETIAKWMMESYVEESKYDLKEGYFVTMFMVPRETTHGKSYRAVVNGARQFNKYCINDYLWPGPNEMQKIFDVLIRSRRYNWLINTDIKSMFMRLLLKEEDKPYLRFFYRTSPEKDLEVWQFTRHVFGLTSSPYCSMLTLRHHAKKNKARFPLAYELTMQDTMVDDVLASIRDEKTLRKAKEELTALYADMGMTSHKWASNNEELLDQIPKEDQATSVSLGTRDEDLYIRTLGMLYCCSPDAFKFVYRPHVYQKDDWTLRRMTSVAGQLYDPLQLLAPVTVKGKMIIQAVWREKLDWDDIVPDSLGQLMTEYCEDHQFTDRVEIPRNVGIAEDELSTLVIFVDASGMAMAAVAYIASQNGGQCDSNLLCSRNKLAPIQGSDTIPRMELAACQIGVELAVAICRCFGWNVAEVCYYSDSMTALWWLQSTQLMTPYVGSRVMRVTERATPEQWSHVRTDENPADLPTRGISVDEIVDCKLWWKGPEFLSKPISEWPARPEPLETAEAAAEVRTMEEICRMISQVSQQVFRNKKADKLADQIMQMIKGGRSLQKGFALLNALVGCLNKVFENQGLNLPVRTHDELMKVLVRKAQADKFPDFKGIMKSNDLVLESPYCDLNLYYDEEDILRTGHSIPVREHKLVKLVDPILLHGEMEIVPWMFQDIHERVLKHTGGIASLLAKVRENYYVIHGRTLAKRIDRSCPWCSLRKQIVPRLPAAPMHESRLGVDQEHLRAFKQIGVDLAGPWSIRNGKYVQKRWLMIIICCVTRVTNVEICYDYSGEAALNALERHVSRYGRPSYVNSDGAKDFQFSARVLQERIEFWRKESDFDQDHTNRVRWLINPASSPTFSGHVETMVKMVKKCLRQIGARNSVLYNHDEFHTVATQAAAFVNTRPYSLAADKEFPLVPADFVLTGHDVLYSGPHTGASSKSMSNRYNAMIENLQDIWTLFHSLYLTEVRRRQERAPHLWRLRVGDVVAVEKENVSRPNWPTGRIIRELTGSDGTSRVYEIEMFHTKNVWKRNWRKLVKIPTPSQSPNL